MAQPTLAELTAAAAAAKDPGFTPASIPRFGGVDPLGLRQINFDLMDEVLPGLNNVARHIRPFVVVSWAWRRANQLAQSGGTSHIKHGELEDFVDRIEVLYVASQVLRDAKADLPGRDYLAPLLRETEFTFGGTDWQQRRKARRYSTALSAPINYGPGLKMLGWVSRHPEYPNIMVPKPAAMPALDAFEAEIDELLHHDAFTAFGPVTVTRDEARAWADAWSLNGPTETEARVMSELLFGSSAPLGRQLGGELMLSAAHASTVDLDGLRAAMAGAPSTYTPSPHLLNIRDAWRRIQVRQLFRFSLEALFYWTLVHLEGTTRSVDSLVGTFLTQAPPQNGVTTAAQWSASLQPQAAGPTELITRIRQALAAAAARDLAGSIATGLAFCLTDGLVAEPNTVRADRLPLSRARLEASARANAPLSEFLRHVLESWVLAQHSYWSVGRGLADARARGRILLRLKIILDEGGWTLTPGVSRGNPPRPTADRLQTAIMLATECGLFV
jgi:hypothetical protein